MSNWEFYKTHYTILASHIMTPNAESLTLGSFPKICRICDRDRLSATFKSKAHIVPEFAGNKSLFSRYECDDCNDRFGQLEDDLAKMTIFSRVLAGVPRKQSGLPSYEDERYGFSIQNAENALHVNCREGSGNFVKKISNQGFDFALQTQPFRPLAAFKSLTKIAYMLMPDEYLAAFSYLKLWLQDKNLGHGQEFGIYGHGCIISKIPGYKPSIPMVALLGRVSEVRAPSCILLLLFGHCGFQVIIPCPSMDHPSLSSKIFSFKALPIEYFIPNASQHLNISYEWADLSNPDKVINTQSWVATGELAA